ncbi:MAG: hypothetical protein CGU29_11360 [Candidatus Dactylopiibacterium carminicum]|uniref:Rhomboid family intramembrane serine protease n=1 Tax=Candidatus Dactylopiibacterium carminicum TaxID=857335 RepID=A0A272EQS9_9RHOO|nr:rhomboid family intramembrane serine protease [Candidatus Dactylopiibacterium carminicum]PAS92467.1 MAG: hypothetical protein CGU29_11360 [Candidatus Dactylopiibacterium carminicum]
MANIMGLVWFCPRLLRIVGMLRLISLCAVSQAVGVAAQSIVDCLLGGNGAPIGLSGIVCGCMAGTAWVVPAKGMRLSVLLFGTFSAVLAFVASKSSTAHAAHLGGMLGGAATAWAIQRVSPGRRGAPRCKVRQE